VNVRAVWEAVFRLHLDRPPRKDALTLNAWLMASGGVPLPKWLALAAGTTLAVLQGLRRRLSLPELAVAMATTLVVTLVLSPQAFSNYYVLLCWLVIVGIAAAGRPPVASP
jgi:hypothetical protein